jgi:hypothetical protein
MATVRSTIPDFQLANPLYVGAQVTFFTVDQNGAKTATLATLYANPTGTQTVANPQTLDSEGKFLAPVYIDMPMIGEVVGATVGSHDTGIIGARGTWRGDWATGTIYFSTDFIVDPVSGNVYAAVDDYTSGASVSADVAAGHLDIVIDQTAIISGGATLAIKVPVDAATTGETLALSGLPVIDGRQTVAGDRILDKDNADPTKRGIYNAAAGAWTRSVDCDASAKFGDGMIVYVKNGTVNHNRAWQCSIPSPFTLGTSQVSWTAAEIPDSAIAVQFGSAPDGVLTTGIKGFHYVPFDCTITAAELIGDAAGSIVIDIWKAAFPTVPVQANSICASDLPTLSNAQTVRDTALTGWTLSLQKGDVLAFNINSVSGLKFVTLNLAVSRN